MLSGCYLFKYYTIKKKGHLPVRAKVDDDTTRTEKKLGQKCHNNRREDSIGMNGNYRWKDSEKQWEKFFVVFGSSGQFIFNAMQYFPLFVIINKNID